MSDQPSSTPESPRSRRHQEYEDPHYHDDDLDIPNDEQPPKPTPTEARRQALRKIDTKKKRQEE